MLKRVLKRSMFATANDDLRPVMNGVYFDQCDGVLNVVASNGHVLIRNAEEVDNLPDSFIMTKKAANLLPTLMDGDDEVVMTFDDRAVRVEQGLMSFTFLMVEGKYPNYMSVIPQDAPYSLTADRQALLKALRNVAHFTNNSSRLVKLTMLSNQTMELRGEDFDFSTEATDRIGIDYPAGRDMTLGVKADSIIDELSRIIEPTVTMHFTDPSRAVTINPIDPLYQGEEITMLLMPMLVNEE
jgi:DNA polymerase-3 subunit beta